MARRVGWIDRWIHGYDYACAYWTDVIISVQSPCMNGRASAHVSLQSWSVWYLMKSGDVSPFSVRTDLISGDFKFIMLLILCAVDVSTLHIACSQSYNLPECDI